MATDLNPTSETETKTQGVNEDQAVEVVETGGRWEATKEKAGPYALRARSAFTRQKSNVGRRVHDWYATADISDEELVRQVMVARQQAEARQEAMLQREVMRLRAALSAATAAAAVDQGHRNATDARVESLAGELAMAEARKDAYLKTRGPQMPVTQREMTRTRWSKKAARGGLSALGGLAWAKGITVEPTLLLATLGAAPACWWWLGRPYDEDDQVVGAVAAPRVSLTKTPTPAQGTGETEGAAYAAAAPAGPVFDAPPPPALDESVLNKALRDCGVIGRDATVKVLSAPAWGTDGTATIVFDLPAGVTVVDLRRKLEAFAGALGRDVSMLDVTKAGAANRASLWMSDEDPFAAARPSPLLKHKGAVDAWRDGVPVAWAKRGNAVCLPIVNSSFLIGGMTRSGKGVGAANLAAGAALDPRVNLRIVAGKTNGEWDPYARAGVASTYFKPDARRLLLLLQALRADMDRRNNKLGELGKSKLTPESIAALGGIELVVIDELATYTRPGKPLREEILEELIELSAVAAGAGILLVLITQYPEVDVIPQGLAMNCGTRWAMRVDNAQQSNAILGGGQSGSGRDASKFDPPLPGLGWLVNPFVGVTDLARSFDLDEDERGEVTQLMSRAAELRTAAERLTGQWEDPIEAYLGKATGLSSAAGGPNHNGVPGRQLAALTPEQRAARDALVEAIDVMDELERDAQLDEMAERIADGMTADRLGELLRAAGAGPTTKITVPHKTGRVNGYRRADLKALLERIDGA